MGFIEIVGAEAADPLAAERKAFVDDALALRKTLKTLVPCELSLPFCRAIVGAAVIAFSAKKPKDVLLAFDQTVKILAKHEPYLSKKSRGEAEKLARELRSGSSVGEIASWLSAGFGLGLGMSLAAVAVTLILGLVRAARGSTTTPTQIR